MTAAPSKRRLRERRRRNGLVCAALAAGLAACAVNPVTGERELALISEEQELAMGLEAARQVRDTIGLVSDPELQDYVSRVGLDLARDSERPDLPWEFGVVEDATPNAFALPGGYIFVTRGLVNLMDSEAELAAVLSHEIAHVTARHSVSQMSRAQIAQLGLGLGTILAPELQQFGELAGAGLNLLFLSYGRDDERQADEIGFRYMYEEDYDVSEMAEVFGVLQRAGEQAGGSPLPSWLASHPSEPERIAAVEERIAALDQPQADPQVGTAEYLRRLEGLVYGENPRNGFFRGSAFYHPELGFSFSVPEEWQKQNLERMVRASGEMAALELTITPVESIEQAAQRFFDGQGLAALDSSSRRLEGNRAIVSEFQADTQEGSLRGYVAHVAHGSAVYQLAAYAPAAAFRQQERVLAQIVTSFQPLEDPGILDVQPSRIEVVEAPRSMTLAEFDDRYPSSIGIEQLALINQLAGADSRIEAGALVKRVVEG